MFETIWINQRAKLLKLNTEIPFKNNVITEGHRTRFSFFDYVHETQ